MNKIFYVISGLAMFLLTIQVANATATITNGPYIFSDNSVANEYIFGTINNENESSIDKKIKEKSVESLSEQNQGIQSIVSGNYSKILGVAGKSPQLRFTTTLANGSTSAFLVTISPTLQQENYPLTDYPCTYDLAFEEDGSDFSVKAIVDVCRNLIPKGVEKVGTSSLESLSQPEIDALRGIINQLKDRTGDFRIRQPNPEKIGFIQQQPYYGGRFYLAHTIPQACNAYCAAAAGLTVLCLVIPATCVPAAILTITCVYCIEDNTPSPTSNLQNYFMKPRRSIANPFPVRQS